MDDLRMDTSVSASNERGRSARKQLQRSAHVYDIVRRDFDPIELIERQNTTRLQELVPIRHERMARSPFAFYRGSALVMAGDLAQRPHTGLTVQLCGDAHLANFGAFASPERALVFDINDFDETLPGPFEWDVKRLVASAVLAARDNGFSPKWERRAALAAARGYVMAIREYAGMRDLDVWYSRITAEELMHSIPRARWRRTYQRGIEKARQRNSLRALSKLAEPVGPELRIKDRPPLIRRIEGAEEQAIVEGFLSEYRQTLERSRRALIDRYRFVSAAYKAVGVGSVGTRCFVALLMGRDQHDPLFLQVKEAGPSVLEPCLGKSEFSHAGERVVTGQRMMQATSDVFLGWATSPRGIQYYVRQLWDWKASIDMASVVPGALTLYAETCGRILARAHARGGDAVAITAYIGQNQTFVSTLTSFAMDYAEQVRRDHQQFCAAIRSGRLPSRKLDE